MTNARSFDSSEYVRRVVDDEIDALFPHLPAILIDGPKAVGKTSTALQRAKTTHRLHRPAERSIAQADPELLLVGEPPILIDEWQYVPDMWDAVKTEVDNNNRGGRFLLTGSMPTTGTHSGAGRITPIRLRPLTLPERGASVPTVSLRDLLQGESTQIIGRCELGLNEYVDLILASGFPGFQRLSGDPLNKQLDGYLARIVDVDMREAGSQHRKPATVMAWLRAYAAMTATSASWDKIRRSTELINVSSPTKVTAAPYVDVLTRLRILDEVQAWNPSSNHLTTLGQTPKHFLADPALAARLTRMTKQKLLRGEGSQLLPRDGAFLGALFESLAALSLLVFAQAAGAELFHLRTHGGAHEVDFIVERPDGKILAVEVKLSNAVETSHVRHLHWLKGIMGPDLVGSVVINTGHIAYRRPQDGVAVVPLGLLGQ
jgi:hypothetical protein